MTMQNDPKMPTIDEFLKMDSKDVAKIVSSSKIFNIGLLVPDGNRKAGLVLWGLDPSNKEFDKDLFSRMHGRFLEVLKNFFDNGIKTLLIPTVTIKNFERGRRYLNAAMTEGLTHFFHDPQWLSFYQDRGIRVRFYGDRDFIRDRGFDNLLKWMEELEKRTQENKNSTLFFGIACDRSWEEVRLTRMGVDLYGKLGRMPTRSELVISYFGEDLPDIGFFIRPTELRDSDMLPVLISGYKTQMYFPICPVGFLTEKVIRLILFDALRFRVKSGGTKIYSKDEIDIEEVAAIKEYYESNLETVIGCGIRKGPFWLPTHKIRVPNGFELKE